MKKSFILFGILSRTIIFSNETKIYSQEVYGQDINTLPSGYIYSHFIDVKKMPSFPKIIQDLGQDSLFKNIQDQAQYFDYFLNPTLLSNFPSSSLNLNYNIEFPESMIKKPYKIYLSIFIQALNKNEEKWVHLVNHCIKDTYCPSPEDKYIFQFKPLKIPIPLESLQDFLKHEELNDISVQSNCQLMLIPYLINQSNCPGKVITQCSGQFEDEDENINKMPYFHFE